MHCIHTHSTYMYFYYKILHSIHAQNRLCIIYCTSTFYMYILGPTDSIFCISSSFPFLRLDNVSMVLLSTLYRLTRSSGRLPSGLCDWPSGLRETGLSVRLDAQVMEGIVNLSQPLRGWGELANRQKQSLTNQDWLHIKQLRSLPFTYLSQCPNVFMSVGWMSWYQCE